MNINKEVITRNLVVYLISISLVIGFYWHSRFYDLGLVPLVIIGSMLTFIVLKIILWTNKETSLLKRISGTLFVTEDEMRDISSGKMTCLIRPIRKSRMRAGQVFTVKVSPTRDGIEEKILINEIYRKRLIEIGAMEARMAGFDNVEKFIEKFGKRFGKKDIVRIINFTRIR